MTIVLVVVSSGRTRTYLETPETADRRWAELTMQRGFATRVEMWCADKSGPMTLIQSVDGL